MLAADPDSLARRTCGPCLAAYLGDMPCNTVSTARPTGTGAAVYSAALFTLGAAAIHLALAPAHFREYVPFGVFFLLVGSAQAIYAIDLPVRPTRRLALLMAAGPARLLGLWAL